MRAWIATTAALLLLAVAIPTASAQPEPCLEKTYSNGGITTKTHKDCSVEITNKPYDCFWGGHWQTTKVGPVTYRQYSCDPYPPT